MNELKAEIASVTPIRLTTNTVVTPTAVVTKWLPLGHKDWRFLNHQERVLLHRNARRSNKSWLKEALQ